MGLIEPTLTIRRRFIVLLVGLPALYLASWLTIRTIIRSRSRSQMSRITGVQVHLSIISRGLERYRQDVGEFPSSEQGLRALHKNPDVEGWDGPYLRSISKHIQGDEVVDYWGNPIRYKPGADGGELWSAGPDKKPENDDDIMRRF